MCSHFIDIITAILCPKLPNPVNGSVSVSGFRVGSKATYECDDGFVLVGLATRKCLITAKWSGEAPVCKRK